MPRTARASVGEICYHVLNRGNGRSKVFHGDSEYKDFLGLFARASERVPMRVLAYCLMPNHFHLVVWPYRDGDLGRWMQALLTAHVRRHHSRHYTSGHIWQGRFKAFPIQDDDHLLTVLRYVERNALRAGLVAGAEDWPWSSLRQRLPRRRPAWMHAGPIPRPRNWIALVNEPMTPQEASQLRRSVIRGSPFGAPEWVARTAQRRGLEFAVRPRGRPQKDPNGGKR